MLALKNKNGERLLVSKLPGREGLFLVLDGAITCTVLGRMYSEETADLLDGFFECRSSHPKKERDGSKNEAK